ncbi:MAG TPA: DOMON domain-containing protein [bacterium]|nr:DOMON domain-containing protein [bacterium]
MRNRARLMVTAAASAALAFAVLTCGCNGDEDGTPPVNPDNGGSITIDRITFTWKPEGKNLNATVKAPTTGWVAVGFDPAIAMKDANLIIGYVKDGQAFIRDDYGSTLVNHKADVNGGGQDNVTNKRGKEEDGVTEIGFTIPLDSGDERDRKLVVGRTYKVLFAYGPDGADNFKSQHHVRTWTRLKI